MKVNPCTKEERDANPLEAIKKDIDQLWFNIFCSVSKKFWQFLDKLQTKWYNR
jgi:hypothetical protein